MCVYVYIYIYKLLKILNCFYIKLIKYSIGKVFLKKKPCRKKVGKLPGGVHTSYHVPGDIILRRGNLKQLTLRPSLLDICWNIQKKIPSLLIFPATTTIICHPITPSYVISQSSFFFFFLLNRFKFNHKPDTFFPCYCFFFIIIVIAVLYFNY